MAVIQEPVTLSLEKILFATDFSLSSAKAEAYARALTRRFGAELQLSHIFDPSVVSSYEGAIIGFTVEERRRASIEDLERLRDSFDGSGLKTRARVAEGHHPGKAILNLVQEHQADMIVLGTESKTGLERILLGSTAEYVIRHADCPVLTVGPNAAGPSADPLVFNRIVFCTDFSPESAKAATLAFSIAEDSGAKLHVCYVEDFDLTDPARRKMLDKGFKDALEKLIPESTYDWCTPECTVERGESAVAILGLAKRVNAELIVLGARKASFWLDHMSHGLTPSVLAEAECPVLTVS